MNTARILIVEEQAGLAGHLENTLNALGYTLTAVPAETQTSQPEAAVLPDSLTGVAIFDAKATCHFINPLAANWLGGQPTDFIGKTCTFIYPELTTASLPQSIRKVIQSNSSHECEIQVMVKGEPRWVSITLRPVLGADGKASMASLKLTDINERKLAVEALHKSEARFRALIEKAAELIVVIDDSGRITFASPAVETIMGYDPQAVLGRSFLEWVHPQDLPQAAASLQSRSRTPGTAASSLIARCQHKNGTWHTLEALGTNLLAEPAVQGIVLNVRDVTQRIQDEEELHLGEERYRNLFENTPVSIWEEDFSLVKPRLTAIQALGISDYATYLVEHPEIAAECASLVRVTAVNRATLTLFHAPNREALLKNLSQLMDEESIKHFNIELVNLLEGKTVFGWEGTNTTFDGQKIEINLRWAAAPGCEESLSRVIISMVDVTERKQTEEQLKKRNREIDLLYNASLELNQSLDPAHLYHTLHNQISAIMECDTLYISAYDPSTRLIRCMGAYHEHHPQDVSGLPTIPLEPPGQGTQSQVIHNAQPWLINDYEREVLSSRVRHYVDADGKVFAPEEIPADADVTRSAILLPLLFRGQVLGVIQIFSYRKNAFTQEDLNMAQALAAQFAIANNNALLYHKAQEELAERERAEQALRESEERYRILLENIPVGITVNIRGETRFANNAAMRLLGATNIQQVIGLSVENIVHPPNQAATRERMHRLLAGENVPYPVEDIYRRLDGSTVPVEVTGVHITFQGEPALLVIATDISQRKAAAQALLEAHALLEERVRERTGEVQDLYDNAPCGYHSLDAEGRFVHINKTELAWMGYAPEQIIGHRITEFMTPVSHANFLISFPHFTRTGSLLNTEMEFVCKDGSVISLLVNATAIFDENRKFKMSRSTLLDISLRKRAEQALRESESRLRKNSNELSIANQALEKAARLKDEFLASMSHELRTPLTGILGLSEAMQMQTYGELSEKQLRTVKNIEKSGRHLLELINDILDLSKIEAGKLELQFEPCPLNEICQASLQLTRGMAQQKQQKVDFSIQPANLVVHADKRRLKQMLVNLLSNAVKFTPEGGQLGMDVRFDNSAIQPVVKITIWDQGIGIHPKDVSRLFEPFIQLDSSLSRQYSGSGLGLSLVKRMVEMHNGSISVESTLGQGSRFTLILPLVATAPTATTINFSGNSAIRPRRAVICDHNLADVEQTNRYLQDLNIVCTHQPDPALIASQVKIEHPDFVLIELNLPGKSGLDVLRELRAVEGIRRTPVIIISAEERRRKAVAMGAAGYLVKPFTQADLRAELEKIFQVPIQPVGPSAPAGSMPLVLLADDNEENLQMLAEFLASRHFQIDRARDGLEMIEHAIQNRPQIILVDIQMPNVDGLEAMRRIRAHPDPQIAAIPLIAITALAMTGDRDRCMAAGANHYMSKPLQLGLLVETISALIKTS